LKKLFKYLDHKEKNRLIKSDFEKAFKDNNIEFTEEDLDRIMDTLDSDGNNSIEYQEFLRAMCDKEALHKDENLKSVFEAIDEDKKGYINVNDIKNFIFKKKEIEDNKFLDYLNKIGMDLNSKLEYDDFVDIIRERKLATIIKPIKQNEIKEILKEEEEKNEEEKNEEIKNIES
jgi:Ca2+-binding EF-hand superfamily protein